MRILVVEDDAKAAAALSRGLQEHGYFVEIAPDGPSGLARGLEGHFDGLVLDIMLPGKNGFTLLQELRANGIQTPVVFLTARDALPDRIRGLELGGGDYLVKPFAFSELLTRLQNLLRRGVADQPRNFVIGNLTIIATQRKVYRGGTRLDLTPQEFALLELLARNAGNIVTRTRIAEELWDLSFDRDPNLVDAAVRRLRKKVDDPFPEKLIKTRRGIGYALECSRV
jgi:two-component system copper resistance phosphate regulon response regulator CusR